MASTLSWRQYWINKFRIHNSGFSLKYYSNQIFNNSIDLTMLDHIIYIKILYRIWKLEPVITLRLTSHTANWPMQCWTAPAVCVSTSCSVKIKIESTWYGMRRYNVDLTIWSSAIHLPSSQLKWLNTIEIVDILWGLSNPPKVKN